MSVLPRSLAQLASMAENMERGGGGGGATQHNFTLADLISNVAEVRDSSGVGIVPNPDRQDRNFWLCGSGPIRTDFSSF